MTLTKVEDSYCLVWAKKIKAINLLGGKCINCGCNNIFSLIFHYNDMRSKENGINQINTLRWSIIEKEIMKCSLLCQNCHHEIHNFGTKRNLKLKRYLLDLKESIKCEQCGYDKNIGSLTFHHTTGKKEFIINACRIRFPDITVDKLIEEMNKCSVLCANCHAEKHVKKNMFFRLKKHIEYKSANYKELRSPLNVEEVVKLYNNGMKQIQISKYLKCSKSTISKIIKENIPL